MDRFLQEDPKHAASPWKTLRGFAGTSVCKGENDSCSRGDQRRQYLLYSCECIHEHVATVMPLCTHWTTPIMLWIYVILVCHTRLSCSLRDNIPVTKNSNASMGEEQTRFGYSQWFWSSTLALLHSGLEVKFDCWKAFGCFPKASTQKS